MTATLSVLLPTEITNTKFVSSTIAETEYPAHSTSATYGIGDRVISTVTHRIYESAKASNLNKDPTDVNNRVGTTIWWIDIGATNRWKMFDTQISSQSSVASPLTVVLTPGAINAIYLAGIDADTLQVSIKDQVGGSVVFTKTVTLEDSAPPDYYEYFFSPFRTQTDVLVDSIPPYANPEVTITLTKSSGKVLCGACVLGDLRPVAETLLGAKSSPKTFSYVKINDAGEAEIKRRRAAKDMTLSGIIDLEEANRVTDTAMDLLDVPAFWIASGDPRFAGLRAYGLGKIEIGYDYPTKCSLSLNVTGLN